MNYLNDLLESHIGRIQEIITIVDINEELVHIAVANLKHLKVDLVATGRNAGILNKVNHQLKMYKQVARIPQLQSKMLLEHRQLVPRFGLVR